MQISQIVEPPVKVVRCPQIPGRHWRLLLARSLDAKLHHYPAAGLPVVAEAVQARAPARWIAADYSCLKGSGTQGPAASAAMWRL
jgi:hypothetical protein